MPRGHPGRCTLLSVALLGLTAPPAWAEDAPIVITIRDGESVMDAIRAVLPTVDTFELLTGVVVLEFEEGWEEAKPDLDCVVVPAELDLTVRVVGRDETDLDTPGPDNVKLPAFLVKAESSSGGRVHLQDVDIIGYCVQPPDSDGTTSRAQLVVNGAREITLVDVTMVEDGKTVVDRSYGLYATTGKISAYNLQAAGFGSGFAVKLTDPAVAFTQVGGAYTGNTWGALGSFGATVALTRVSFVDNRLVGRGLGLDWDSAGGSIYAEGGALTLSEVSFSNDWAPQVGGAIAMESVRSFTGCGLSFVGSAAGGYGGAIAAVHSDVTLDAGEDGDCGVNGFVGVKAPTGAALSLSQDNNGDQIYATLSWLELSQVDGDAAISSSLSGPLTLTDVSTPGGLGPAGLLFAEGNSNPQIGPITASRLHVRGRGEPVPDGRPLIGVENTGLTLTESTFCGLVAGPSAVSMISIADPTASSTLQRNTIWGGWSDLEESALVSAQWSDMSTTRYTFDLLVIDNTLIGSGTGRGVTIDESVTYSGVNNLLNALSVGHFLFGEVARLSHNLYGPSVADPLIGNGGDVAAHEVVGRRPELLTPLSESCADLPLLRSTSPAVGAGFKETDSDLAIYNELLSYNGVPYYALDDIGAQPVELVDRDGDGFAEDEDCADLVPEVNPSAEELPGNGLDDDCDPSTSDALPEEEDDEPLLFEYSGGRSGCATAPRPLSALALALALALAWRRNREP